MPFDLYRAWKNSRVLTRENAPGFVRCVEELARKAGTRVSKVRLLPTSSPNAAFHLAEGAVWVTEGALHMFDSANLHAPPSKEMQAIIAHELGHARFRWKHFGPSITLIGGLPMLGMGAMYLIDKTNEKVRKEKKEHPDQAKAFWEAFREVTHERRQKGMWWTYKDFYKWGSPEMAKLFSKDPNYKEMSWFKAYGHEAKILAVQAAMLVPALAACRPFALRNEYEADRFAVALMGEGRSFAAAMTKFMNYSKEKISGVAKTPLQRTWAEKIGQALRKFVNHTVAAHPETSERIKLAHQMDPAALAKSFGINP